MLCVLLSLVSCGASAPVSEKEETAKEDELSQLSAEALYEIGLQKTRALSGFAAKTSIVYGDEALPDVETVRIREGYDGFSYSRKGGESVYFSEGTIYTLTSLGNYLAEATARDAQDYIDTYFFPVQLLAASSVTNLKKEGMTLTFSLKTGDDCLSLFAAAVPAEKGVFTPTSMTGEIEVGEDGVFKIERYTVSGQNAAGESVNLALVTEMTHFRASEVEVLLPTTEYAPLSDIRIPHYLHDAEMKLASVGDLQATILGSETVKIGDQSWAFNLEETFYQKEGGDAYLSRQTLKNLPPLPEGAEPADPPVKTEDSRFYQFLLENGVKKENEYDVIAGILLGENTSEGQTADWKGILDGVLLDPACLGEFSLSNDRENITVSFTLNENGIKKLSARIAANLPESGFAAESAVGTGSGVLTLSADTHVLTAFSVAFEGTSASASYNGRYSLTVDATENITFPAWQTPTATTPGEMGAVHDHDH